MRRYRTARIQKTLIALSGAALASTLMFTSAQNTTNPLKDSNNINSYYKNTINQKLQEAKKAQKEERHKKQIKIKKEKEL